jgi:hypothetical protein
MSLKDTTPQPGLRHLDATYYIHLCDIKFNKSRGAGIVLSYPPEHVFKQETLVDQAEESSGVFVGLCLRVQLIYVTYSPNSVHLNAATTSCVGY